jgi:uncharacterized spore protein YtfJ
MGTAELLSRLAENVSVRRAFGAAYEKDGLLIIPVALVAGGGGGGGGTYPPPVATASGAAASGAAASGAAASGAATSGATASGAAISSADVADVAGGGDGQTAAGRPAGSGSGGGFGGLIMPVGVYVVNGDQVRWVPAVDVTVIVLASLGAVRLLAGLGSRARRRRLTTG